MGQPQHVVAYPPKFGLDFRYAHHSVGLSNGLQGRNGCNDSIVGHQRLHLRSLQRTDVERTSFLSAYGPDIYDDDIDFRLYGLELVHYLLAFFRLTDRALTFGQEAHPRDQPNNIVVE